MRFSPGRKHIAIACCFAFSVEYSSGFWIYKHFNVMSVPSHEAVEKFLYGKESPKIISSVVKIRLLKAFIHSKND
jgi:hypothetical protein